CVAAALFAISAFAQTAPQPPQKPKPGTIIDRPDAGRITNAPEPPKPAQPSPANAALAGQRIERFEVTGNTSVASDTIRVYLGVNIGETFSPELLQQNFLNLWQTGLFD